MKRAWRWMWVAAGALLVAGCGADRRAANADAVPADHRAVPAAPQAATVPPDATDRGASSAAPTPAPSEPEVADTPAPAPDEPARTEVRTLERDGLTRRYLVHVPAGAADSTRPVVFVFHGTGESSSQFSGPSGWEAVADGAGAVLVFPDALTYCYVEAGARKVVTKWDAGQFDLAGGPRLCRPAEVADLPGAQRAKVTLRRDDDVAFFDEMLSAVRRDERIDPARVYAAGFSNGGQMVARLAVERSERLTAVAVASGDFAVPVTPPARPVPILYSIGTADGIFPKAFTTVDLPADVTVLATPFGRHIVEELRTVASVEAAPVVTTPQVGGRRMFVARYLGSAGEARMIVLDDTGHVYANGRNHPLVLAEETWSFFSQFPAR